jgi:hypothetical protein
MPCFKQRVREDNTGLGTIEFGENSAQGPIRPGVVFPDGYKVPCGTHYREGNGHVYSKIADFVIDKATSKGCPDGRVFKPVLHEKRDDGVYVPSGCWTIHGLNRKKDTFYITRWKNGPRLVYHRCKNLTPKTPVAPVLVSPEELRAAFTRIHPDRILDDLQGANFILELRELHQLTDMLVRKGRTVTQYGTDAFVGTNFGIDPVVSDAKTALKLIHSLESFVKRWNDFARKGKIMDFHETIFQYNLSDPPRFITEREGPWEVEYMTNSVNRQIAKLHLYVKPRRISTAQLRKLKLRKWGFESLTEIVGKQSHTHGWLIIS